MVKELIDITVERDSLQQKFGFVVQGGADLALTAKIASVKTFSPAHRAGLKKMDYVHLINGKEVFNMTQPEIVKEIKNSDLELTLQVERGTFIVPSFDEIWPQDKSVVDGKRRRGKDLSGLDYYMDAMQHHGLGHLPQPDNFTTCGKLNIEINQYNNPVECYSDETIEDMRDEKVLLENPDHAEKIIAANAAKHKKTDNPVIEQQMRKFDPSKSSVYSVLSAHESGQQGTAGI